MASSKCCFYEKNNKYGSIEIVSITFLSEHKRAKLGKVRMGSGFNFVGSFVLFCLEHIFCLLKHNEYATIKISEKHILDRKIMLNIQGEIDPCRECK